MMLHAEKLVVRYGPVLALDGLSLSLADGERVSLIGPNGAGKSTAVKALAGIAPISEGHIVLDGDDHAGRTPGELVRSGLTLVPQGRRLFNSLTVRENLEMGAYADNERAQIQADIDRWCGRFPEIGPHLQQRAGSLSGGQQQIVALMRGLMARPRVLMLDEPSMGVAPLIVRRIGEELRRLNEEEGLAVLLVEQNVELALDVGQRIVVMSQGRNVHEGNPDELRDAEVLATHFFGVSGA